MAAATDSPPARRSRSRREFAWGRWIRVSIAHHYLAIDRRIFDLEFKPHLTVIAISRQARAYIKAEIDALAIKVETLHRVDRPAPTKGDIWAEAKPAASPLMPTAIASSVKPCTANGSLPALAPSARTTPSSGSRARLSG